MSELTDKGILNIAITLAFLESQYDDFKNAYFKRKERHDKKILN